jgi:hypothetical protein
LRLPFRVALVRLRQTCWRGCFHGST